MQSKLILLLAAFFALSQGFDIPTEQGDGVYMAWDNPETPPGEMDYTRVGDLPNLNISDIAEYEKRGLSSSPKSAKFRVRDYLPSHDTFCLQNIVTSLDVLSAKNALKKACGIYFPGLEVPEKNHLYAVSGAVAAYFCNYKGNAGHCMSQEVEEAFTDIGN